MTSSTARAIRSGKQICCGSAGIYNLLNPEAGRELGDRKAANVAATGAEVLVVANPGCLMQVAAALQRASASIVLATRSRCWTSP